MHLFRAGCLAIGLLWQLPTAWAQPANFRTVAQDVDRLYLAWDTLAGVDGYILLQSSDSVTFVPIDTIMGGSTGKRIVNGLMANTPYYFNLAGFTLSGGPQAAAGLLSSTTLGQLTHHFALDAVDGDTVINLQGGVSGTVQGPVQVVPAGSSGLPVPAIKFEQDELQAIHSWIRLSDAIAGTPLAASIMSRTISFWFKNDQPAFYSVPLSFGKRTGLTVAFQNDSLYVITKQRVNGPWYDAIGGVPFSDTGWHQLVYVYRDPVTTVYLDGAAIFSFDGSGEWPYPQQWLINGPGDRSYEIGAQEDPDFSTQKHLGDNFDVGARNYFYGEMAQLKMWNYAVSEADILADYLSVLPATPANFRTVATDIDRLYLAWDTVAGADGYILSQSLDSVTFTLVDTLAGAGVNKVVVEALAENTPYFFTLTSYSGLANSQVATTSGTTHAAALTHHFALDAVDGDTVINLQGGVSGTVQGTVQVVPAGTSGLPLPAVKFVQDELQGIQSWIRLSSAITNTPIADAIMSRTVSFWFKNDQPALYSVPLSFGKRTGLTVAFQNDSLYVITKQRVNGPWYDAIGGVPFSDNGWHQLYYVYRDPVTTVYLDGVAIFSFDGSGEWPYPQRWLINGPGDRSYEIGAQEDPDFSTQKHLGDNFDVGARNFFHGEMAQLKMWNYAVPADSILADYNSVFISAPASFQVAARDADRLLLLWPAVTGADGYKIYQDDGAGTFSEIASVGSTTPYVVDGLTANTAYNFEIEAFNANSSSARVGATGSTVDPRLVLHLPLDALVGDTAVMEMVSGTPLPFEGTLEVEATPGISLPATRFVQDELAGVQSWLRLNTILANNELIQSLMARSFTMWIKDEAPTGGYEVPISFGKRTGLALALRNDTLFAVTKHRVNSPWYYASGSSPLAPETWHHIAYVYRDPVTDIYIDGNLAFSFDGTGVWPYPQRWLINGPGDRSFEIGALEDPDFALVDLLGDNFDVGPRNFFTGLMADARFYNYAITPEEVTNSFNSVTSVAAPLLGVKVYPNPAREQLHIELSQAGQATFSLMDLQGRSLRQVTVQQQGMIPVQDLTPGVYLLRGTLNGQLYLTKVVITP